MEFSRDGKVFEVDMGEDLFKLIFRPKKPYIMAFIKSFMDSIDTSKTIIIPPDIDIIIVRNDGTMEKY